MRLYCIMYNILSVFYINIHVCIIFLLSEAKRFYTQNFYSFTNTTLGRRHFYKCIRAQHLQKSYRFCYYISLFTWILGNTVEWVTRQSGLCGTVVRVCLLSADNTTSHVCSALSPSSLSFFFLIAFGYRFFLFFRTFTQSAHTMMLDALITSSHSFAIAIDIITNKVK